MPESALLNKFHFYGEISLNRVRNARRELVHVGRGLAGGCLLLAAGCAPADSISVGGHSVPVDVVAELDDEGVVEDVPDAVDPSDAVIAPGLQPRAEQFDFQLSSGDGSSDPEFESCGGEVSGGRWIVEDTINPRTDSRAVLERWGEQQMNLYADSCVGAVKHLTVNWSGELIVDTGAEAWLTTDHRIENRLVDIEIGPECLRDLFEVETSVSATPTNCAALETPVVTSCEPEGDACRCLGRQDRPGDATGQLTPISSEHRLLVTTYDENGSVDKSVEAAYCVRDGRLSWKREGSNRIVVMRHESVPPRPQVINRDPVAIPR